MCCSSVLQLQDVSLPDFEGRKAEPEKEGDNKNEFTGCVNFFGEDWKLSVTGGDVVPSLSSLLFGQQKQVQNRVSEVMKCPLFDLFEACGFCVIGVDTFWVRKEDVAGKKFVEYLRHGGTPFTDCSWGSWGADQSLSQYIKKALVDGAETPLATMEKGYERDGKKLDLRVIRDDEDRENVTTGAQDGICAAEYAEIQYKKGSKNVGTPEFRCVRFDVPPGSEKKFKELIEDCKAALRSRDTRYGLDTWYNETPYGLRGVRNIQWSNAFPIAVAALVCALL
jgi:hypothetical protein